MSLGVGVMLALVLGGTTVALAAVPGDPLKLGRINSINKLSTLVGNLSSPMLRVQNKGTGTALNLRVQAGKPPLTVNSGGRVAKLNADRVDGKHANQLAVKTAFTSGFGANPTSALQFLAPPALVTVGAGQAVQVTSNKAFGSTVAGGASSLNLFICSRPEGSIATPNAAGSGILGNRVAQSTRVTMGLSAVIAGLSPGSYRVGLCGSSSNAANWNSNEFGYTSALVVTQPSGAAASTTSVQSR
ncbi:MAG: hypothetical protein GEU74_11475 [Nitriliruptorales bacterium]|nr:hypothetical protein [Nitriliruptorales bacterium]